MRTDTQAWEAHVLHDLRAFYEGRGLKFFIDPPMDLVPPFLGGYQPDAIALAPDGGGAVIEVKRYDTVTARRHMQELASKVGAHSGWEFRGIVTNTPTDRPDFVPKPTWSQVEDRLGEIAALRDGGHNTAALMLGWSVLESLARLASDPRRPGGLSPLQAVQALAEEGYLEHEDAERLRDMAKTRNAVAHGDLSLRVTPDDASALLRQLAALKTAIADVEAGAQA